jgi:hypothetical protein
MTDVLPTLAAAVAERFEGPMHARLIVQPFAAIMLALIDGLSDADQRQPPYLWSLLHSTGQDRRRLAASAARGIGKVLALALILDVAHQFIALRLVDLGDALLMAGVLAVAPYAVFRGLVTRLATEPLGSRSRDRRPTPS